MSGITLFTGLRFHLSPDVGEADHNRPVDGGPGSDILRCVDIGVLSMAAGTAAERCLAWAVAGMNEPAGTALLACIRSVDHLHPDTTPSGLVLDERTELMERPLVMSLALVTSNRGPQEDAREVFESNPSLRAFCRVNDSLADDVVGIGLKPALSAAVSAWPTWCPSSGVCARPPDNGFPRDRGRSSPTTLIPHDFPTPAHATPGR